MVKLLKMIKSIIVRFLWYIFRIFPIDENKIVINQFNGLGYGDNPKYICEEIFKQKLPYKIIWLVRDNQQILPKNIQSVKIRTLKAIYHLVTSKVWISNVRIPFYVSKRKEQYYIQTWHGGLGLKKVEKDAEMFLDKEYVKIAKKDSKIADLFISNCSYRSKMYKESFWYDGDIMEVGTPRNDFLVNNLNNSSYKSEIKKNINIRENCKIILYAPTYRDNDDMSVYMFQYEEFIKCAQDKFGCEFIMLIKLHPNMIHKSNFIKYNEKIINVSGYEDMQELLLISDILITDYSSCMFDIILLKKIVMLYSKDYENYVSGRGINFDYFSLPFKVSRNNNDLINNIKNYDEKLYTQQINNFLKDFGMIETGRASKEIIKKIGEWRNEKV